MEGLKEESEFRQRFQKARVMVERLLQDKLVLQKVHRNGPPSSSNCCGSSRMTEDLQEWPGAVDAPQPVEGADNFLQLLKSHRQAVEEVMRELRRRNEELEKERDKAERERLWMRHCIDQLLAQGGNLYSQPEVAERGLSLKQGLIDQPKEKVEQQKGSLETVPVLTAQIVISKADFLAEQAARERLNKKNEELQDQLNEALAEIDRLKEESIIRARMEQMMQRHQCFPIWAPHIPPPQDVFSSAAFDMVPPAPSCHTQAWLLSGQRADTTEKLLDLCCPKCHYEAPDMDTLQIHVMDCIV